MDSGALCGSMCVDGEPLCLDVVVSVEQPGWEEAAIVQLRENGYARLKLSAAEAECVQQLYPAAHEAFASRTSRQQMAVLDWNRGHLDSRQGYVDDGHRQFLELHPVVGNVPMRPQAPNST